MATTALPVVERVERKKRYRRKYVFFGERREKQPGRIAQLKEKILPHWLWWEQHDGYVLVGMPGKPPKDTWLRRKRRARLQRRLTRTPYQHRKRRQRLKRALDKAGPKPGYRDYSYKIWRPLVFLPATHRKYVGWRRAFTSKVYYAAQFVYKGIGGWLLNKVGYKFYVFTWYGVFSNPGTRPWFNNPLILVYTVAHLLHIKVGGHVPDMPNWYDDLRHFNFRDGVQLAFRGSFAWLAFVKPTSRRRQMVKQGLIPHPLIARILAKIRIKFTIRFRHRPWTFDWQIFASEATPGFAKWYQYPAAPVGMFIGAVLAILPVYGVVELLGLADHAKFGTFYANGLKVAGFAGALVAKFFIEKFAVDFSDLLSDAYEDRGFKERGKQPFFLVPSNIRALFNSDMHRIIRGNQKWLFAMFVVLAGVLAFTFYSGGWILNNLDWLHPLNRNLFSGPGIHRWLEATNMKWPHNFVVWLQSWLHVN